MGRIAKSQQQARAKARQRRIALDQDRAIRDERVEAAAGEVFLALAERADASGQIRTAEVRAGDALQRILAEGIKADGVAQLCDLPVGEVHRLRRAAQTAQDSRGDVDPGSEAQPRSPDERVATGAALSRRSERGSAQLPPEQPAATAPARRQVDVLSAGRPGHAHPTASRILHPQTSDQRGHAAPT